MEHEVLEPEQFWDDLQAIVSKPCDSEDLIDDALREYLSFITKFKDEFLPGEYDISRCSYKLFVSSIFEAHTDYVRRQIIYGLLQEDDPNTLHVIVSFLLFDGRQNEVVLKMLNEEGAFARLLELIQAVRRDDLDGGLHRILMDLIYEMSRIQRMKIEDLVLVDDNFIRCLFDIIEDLSYDVTDPYHYPVIRVLLVLNEQFMISAHDPVDDRFPGSQLTNKVIKVLSVYGSLYKTFGENIILLINREGETSLQLLTLKLLYLIFTTPSTYEYFFTNDLHVLVDILIRNLLDLPEEASALRHTYLRVLYPLLAHTQLRLPPHYKREELRKTLNILVRGQVSYGNETDHDEKMMHFEEVDDTTRRLVTRCATVEWLRNMEQPDTTPIPDAPIPAVTASIDTVLDEALQESPTEIAGSLGESLDLSRTVSCASSIPESPTRMDSRGSSVAPDFRGIFRATARLGMNLEPANSSTLSVQAVAAQHVKPGIITPSRKDNHPANVTDAPIIRPPKIRPEPPKSRRWRGRRLGADDDEHSAGTSSDHNTIPEGIEIGPTSHTAPTTPAPTTPVTSQPPPVDRRNSTTSSHLMPPVPGHSRRSASNPPPAVPPPRRSHSTTPSSYQQVPPVAIISSMTMPSKHGQKPPPPKARRWGRGKAQHGQTDSMESGTSSGSLAREGSEIVETTLQPPEEPVVPLSDPFSPTSPSSPTLLVSPTDVEHHGLNGGTGSVPLSVEEAVQNMSLN
ncbi:hypothetical protein N7495_003612 [Penicillium taxi]|uniref:uncharacterized protein n=1 Tax=Penicillium taxi TaxID=168475 RepID=UPI00254541C6|nr:uncharacterized protein N7495_003612 [Penicillium taxi]KAJ5898868.1 hypothetical protein N7495_003612 [Penicillium taxi]